MLKKLIKNIFSFFDKKLDMTDKERELIRQEFKRLNYPKDLQTAHESYKVILDVGWKVYKDHVGTNTTVMGQDAHLLYQMVLLKSISIQSLAEGKGYQNDLDPAMALLGDTIDVFGIWNLVRSQFESVCTFNHIYLFPTDQKQKELLYDLWQVAGLKYRQRFAINLEGEENIKKAATELKDIEFLTNRICNSPAFTSIHVDEQTKIKNAVKGKDFQWYFDGSRVKQGAWHQLCKNMGTNDLFDNMYTYLSLSTHPSSVSIFQFKDLYKNKDHVQVTMFALSISKALISFLIRDYCTYFAECRKTFDNLPIVDQLLVNFYNSTFREKKYQINDIGHYI